MAQRNLTEELVNSIDQLRADRKWDPITTFSDKTTSATLTYAWNWFSYHSNQRLTAFHFFLIIVGFLVAGYITCFDKKLFAMQVVLGGVGVLISIAFLALDFRNEQLVDDGRDALIKLELALGMGFGIHTVDAACDKHVARRETLLFGIKLDDLLTKEWNISHSVWLRRIERVALGLFLAAVILGGYKWCYEKPVEVVQPACTPSK